jgi:hypothetical protein
LEKEREFYFSKLTLIEQLITKHGLDKMPLGKGMLKILYAGEDEKVEMTDTGDLILQSADGKTSTHKIEKTSE